MKRPRRVGRAEAALYRLDARPGSAGMPVRRVDMDGDHRADLTVAAPGDDRVRSSAWLLPGTDQGLSDDGGTRPYGDSFERTGKLDLSMGGGGIARQGSARPSRSCSRGACRSRAVRGGEAVGPVAGCRCAPDAVGPGAGADRRGQGAVSTVVAGAGAGAGATKEITQ
ncbi:hypothetical protein GCM10009579_04530 [Streptomyces javensis]|uniref:Uncharacterized protein n=1 Tax=Streptomyces javensis TaxID=114698 RepID=A0ABP4H979_9ACTN